MQKNETLFIENYMINATRDNNLLSCINNRHPQYNMRAFNRNSVKIKVDIKISRAIIKWTIIYDTISTAALTHTHAKNVNL